MAEVESIKVETPTVETPVEIKETDPAVHQEAVRDGWVDKEAWVSQGKPEEKWTTAEDFVERGRSFAPFIKAKNRRLEERLERNEQTLAQVTAYMSREAANARLRMELAVKEKDRAIAMLREQKAAAIAQADGPQVVAVEKQIDDLKESKANDEAILKSVNLPQPQVGAPQPTPQEQASVEAWVSRNQWYASNTKLRAAADGIGLDFRAKHPMASPQDVMDFVESEMQDLIPRNPRRTQAANVEEPTGSKPASTSRGKKMSYGDLDQQAKEICDMVVRDSGGKITRDKFIEDYTQGSGVK